MKTKLLAPLVLSLAALGSPPALSQATGLTLSMGLDYASGKYGTPDKEDTTTIPFIVKYETGPLTLKATLPWVRRTGLGRPEVNTPANTPATRSSTSGQGDLVTSASYTVYDNRAAGIGLDVTGKIKFGTADETKLLGTGENDYAIQGDLFKSYERGSAFGTLGWKKMGDPAGVNYRNPWYASLGGSYKLAPATSAGLAYDYRQRVVANGAHVSEISAFVTHRFGQGLKLQGYLVKGFADASPDWGAGAIMSYGF